MDQIKIHIAINPSFQPYVLCRDEVIIIIYSNNVAHSNAIKLFYKIYLEMHLL